MDRRQFLQASAGSLLLSSCLPTFASAFADDPKSAALIQTLPKDGAWAEFNVNMKVNGQEIVPKWSARSVGQAFHGGKQCRFIEMEQVSDNPVLPNMTWRFLVPEEEFGEGKDPVSKAVKLWVKMGTNDPEAVDTIEIKDPIFARCCWQDRSKTSKPRRPRKKSTGNKVIWNARWSAAVTKRNWEPQSSACRIESFATKTFRSVWPECSKS